MRRGFLNKAGNKKAPWKEATRTPAEAIVKPVQSIGPKGDVLGLESLQKLLEGLDLAAEAIEIPATRYSLQYGTDAIKFPNLEKGMRLVSVPCPPNGRPAAVCLFFDGTKEALLKKPGWPSPIPYVIFPSQLPYENKHVEGKGIITLATKNLQPGEVIMCERPLIVLTGALPTGPGMLSQHMALKNIVDNLCDGSKYIFYSLANCKGPEVHHHVGIVDTNAVIIGVLPGPYKGSHAAVCSAFSRVNHSCVPNAKFNWDLDSFSYTVRAIHPIAKGQEITVTYLGDDYRPREERIKELKNKYDFLCTCTCCTLPKIESNRSDVRRSLLKHSKLGHVQLYIDQDKTVRKMLKKPEQLEGLIGGLVRTLHMMDEEKVYDLDTWMAHATMLCKIYCALGRREDVVALANKSSIMAVTWNGVDEGWYKLAKAPENTVWWNLAKKLEAPKKTPGTSHI